MVKNGKFATHRWGGYDDSMCVKFCSQVELIEIFLTKVVIPWDRAYGGFYKDRPI